MTMLSEMPIEQAEAYIEEAKNIFDGCLPLKEFLNAAFNAAYFGGGLLHDQFNEFMVEAVSRLVDSDRMVGGVENIRGCYFEAIEYVMTNIHPSYRHRALTFENIKTLETVDAILEYEAWRILIDSPQGNQIDEILEYLLYIGEILRMENSKDSILRSFQPRISDAKKQIEELIASQLSTAHVNGNEGGVASTPTT